MSARHPDSGRTVRFSRFSEGAREVEDVEKAVSLALEIASAGAHAGDDGPLLREHDQVLAHPPIMIDADQPFTILIEPQAAQKSKVLQKDL